MKRQLIPFMLVLVSSLIFMISFQYIPKCHTKSNCQPCYMMYSNLENIYLSLAVYTPFVFMIVATIVIFVRLYYHQRLFRYRRNSSRKILFTLLTYILWHILYQLPLQIHNTLTKFYPTISAKQTLTLAIILHLMFRQTYPLLTYILFRDQRVLSKRNRSMPMKTLVGKRSELLTAFY
ncbi:unnamed protein product [Didymodactylos carnosus]|uniref:G-protein coupled receptors family 1 profile domain-containing protein n=1 Tax=Didymodactylos carnosus TaxID=1234261 RepID=A0A815AJK9_9BILA|nr:unnamed protein product [Didymodactylos carnosus]CAF1256663.1 unnamed protein product [Didymodactylos carnosus]CAF3977269.1 unnamed protein product [Didymodactylos carnosus]CAF4030430.1 unnamed protein product [Didymodactylos carnosus]